MLKLKPLLPSLKEKKHYLVFEVISEKKLNFNDIKDAINNGILIFLGQLDTAKAGVQFLPEEKNNCGMIRANPKYINKIKAALTLIEKIKNNKVIVKSKGVSGTINKAKRKFLEV